MIVGDLKQLRDDWKAHAELAICEWLDVVDRESAKLSEFTVDMPLTARRKLDRVEREVALALLSTLEVLERNAQALAEANDPGWEALADVATWLTGDIGRRGLPQLSRVHNEIADLDDEPDSE